MTEPIIAVQSLLRAQMTDYNSTDRIGDNWIYPDWPRVTGNGALSKNSYPRISIIDISETGEPLTIGNTAGLFQTILLQIDVWIWSKDKDAMILVIDSDNYEGTRLRDKIARDVINELRNHFYSDTNTKYEYSDFNVTGMRSIDFDEVSGILRKTIDIQFTKVED